MTSSRTGITYRQAVVLIVNHAYANIVTAVTAAKFQPNFQLCSESSFDEPRSAMEDILKSLPRYRRPSKPLELSV